MTANLHVPVLPAEVLEALAPVADGTLVDCTLGGAGHARSMLDRFPKARLLACDVDPSAVSNAERLLAAHVAGGRARLLNCNFTELVGPNPPALPGAFAPPWDGVLLDLGYSSNQLEDPAYGMSFSPQTPDAPLDMRLSRHGQTAWELLNDATDTELADILRAYGEIRGAGRMARGIKEGIASGAVTDSTHALSRHLERLASRASKHGRSRTGRRGGEIHPATLAFQALRIAVNDELRALDHFLEGVILKTRPGARLAVISFHSLEDRVVKRWGQRNGARVRSITKKPLQPTRDEVATNPRARSAKLRVFERT